jgi:hypothetical protein
MQDNDPIRRPCLGNGKTNNRLIAGEEVCNLDNALGLVLPMTDTSWIIGQMYADPAGGFGPPLVQYPTNNCNDFAPGLAPKVLNCPVNRGSVHDGECPNGDSETAGACIIPIDGTNNRSDCVATKATIPVIVQRTTLGSQFGRAYNLHMRDGTVRTDGSYIGYAQYPLFGGIGTVDFAGAFNRIHQVATAVGKGASGCQLVDMTDQIGCLTSADPCSIGFAGFGASVWQQQPNPAPKGTDPAGTWNTGALGIVGVIASTSRVQELGTSSEYQLSRKLYFNSLLGFGAVNAEGAAGTAGDPGAASEIILAQYESVATNIQPILAQFGYFGLGALSPQGTTNQPFCEDFNEKTICGAATNVNGCVNNNSVAGIPGETGPNPNNAPTQSTICGDGIVEAFEECDGTARAGAGGCTSTCRCVLDYNPSGTGACN